MRAIKKSEYRFIYCVIESCLRAASSISYTLCSMKCAPVVAHYYQDYHEFTRRGAKHNDRDISRVAKSFDFFHEKMVHLSINCGRASCCSRKGCPRAFCAIIGDCIGTVGTVGTVGKREIESVPVLTFLLGDLTQPLIIPQRGAHCPDDLHKIGVPSASARSNRAGIQRYTYMVCFDSDVRSRIAGTT